MVVNQPTAVIDGGYNLRADKGKRGKTSYPPRNALKQSTQSTVYLVGLVAATPIDAL